MPRNYGRFTTSIWRDPDFTSLTLAQQAVYFMLCTQPEITAAGTLPLTLRRWAKNALGETPESISHELDALREEGHVAIDADTEELLVVKFIKWDQGWYNEKRWPLVRDAIGGISSAHIRDIAVDELRRLALSDGVSDTASARVRDWLSGRESRSDRSVVTEGESVPNPQTANLEGEPSPPLADDPSSPFCPTHQPDGPGGKPCTGCADRSKAKKHREARAVLERAEAKAAVAQRIADCNRCNDQGFVEGPDGELLGKCSHSDLRVVSVVARGVGGVA